MFYCLRAVFWKLPKLHVTIKTLLSCYLVIDQIAIYSIKKKVDLLQKFWKDFEKNVIFFILVVLTRNFHYTQLMKVAIFFGSKSDKDTMKKAADVLTEFGVDYKAYIISAHRAGALLKKTVEQVEADGAQVIIAGAGLAAALPGVIAGITTLPVIGVPLECVSEKSNGLGGMDALLSIVQMPPQIPVATVGINSAKNAAYLALQILALQDKDLAAKLKDFRKGLADAAEKDGIDISF